MHVIFVDTMVARSVGEVGPSIAVVQDELGQVLDRFRGEIPESEADFINDVIASSVTFPVFIGRLRSIANRVPNVREFKRIGDKATGLWKQQTCLHFLTFARNFRNVVELNVPQLVRRELPPQKLGAFLGSFGDLISNETFKNEETESRVRHRISEIDRSEAGKRLGAVDVELLSLAIRVAGMAVHHVYLITEDSGFLKPRTRQFAQEHAVEIVPITEFRNEKYLENRTLMRCVIANAACGLDEENRIGFVQKGGVVDSGILRVRILDSTPRFSAKRKDQLTFAGLALNTAEVVKAQFGKGSSVELLHVIDAGVVQRLLRREVERYRLANDFNRNEWKVINGMFKNLSRRMTGAYEEIVEFEERSRRHRRDMGEAHSRRERLARGLLQTVRDLGKSVSLDIMESRLAELVKNEAVAGEAASNTSLAHPERHEGARFIDVGIQVDPPMSISEGEAVYLTRPARERENR